MSIYLINNIIVDQISGERRCVPCGVKAATF